MWQDSGRYEWPLLQVPGEQTTAPATQTVLPAYDSQSLVVPGPSASAAGIVLDTRLCPEQAQQEIADLRRQVEVLKTENCDLLLGHAELTRRLNELRAQVAQLEQAAERHAGTL